MCEAAQVIEFCPRGNLAALAESDVFDSDATAWIVAQGALAIDAVHRHGFAHR